MRLSDESATRAEPSGIVFDIQRFSLHDGPGIRTTVFLKGCPLDCLWCHNPESKKAQAELALYSHLCGFCGACAAACPQGFHCLADGTHILRREDCTACGRCAGVCPASALTILGRPVTAGEIIDEALKDAAFYAHSGGGITLSGGEPFFQPAFTLAVLQAAKAAGLHTCVETSGFAAWEDIERAAAFTDLFLYDCKETDDALHRRFTGVSNALILENLLRLDGIGAKIVLRCPIIPNHNDRPAHHEGIERLAARLRNPVKIEKLPYHALGASKAQSIGEAYPEQLFSHADSPAT